MLGGCVRKGSQEDTGYIDDPGRGTEIMRRSMYRIWAGN